MDAEDRAALAATLRRAMTADPGAPPLAELGWHELLAAYPDVAVPLVLGLLGETGAVAPVLVDVVGQAELPYAGGRWVRWGAGAGGLDPGLPLEIVDACPPLSAGALAAGRVAAGWWLTGAGRRMLTLAREHALARVQFGRPIASFQAVRHRLAEAFVALEGAEATLALAADPFGALLAKAAAGRAALTVARHAQQVLGGMGFTAEHEFHRHYRRVLVLDGLLGSARELTREAGALIRAEGTAPRLPQL